MPAETLCSTAHNRGKKKLTSQQLSQKQCIRYLSDITEHGVLFRGSVWMSCTRQLAYILDRLCIGRRVPGEAAVGMPLFLNTSTNTCAEPCNLSPVTMLDPCRAIIIRLSPHESFYAAWILKFLTVYTSAPGSCDKNEKQTALCRLSLLSHWRVLLRVENARTFGRQVYEDTPDFVPRLASFVHFRKAGWLLKSGLQYGSDFVLYRNVPSLVHSDHCVVIQPSSDALAASERLMPFRVIRKCLDIETPNYLESERWLHRQIDFGCWVDVQAVSRLCGQVSKTFIFAQILCPWSIDISKDKCIHLIRIKEARVARFIAEENK